MQILVIDTRLLENTNHNIPQGIDTTSKEESIAKALLYCIEFSDYFIDMFFFQLKKKVNTSMGCKGLKKLPTPALSTPRSQ